MSAELRILKECKENNEREKTNKKRVKNSKRREADGNPLRPARKQVKTLPQIDKDRYGELQPSMWYHARMTPNERLTKLKAMYKQFAEIVKSQMSYYHGNKNEFR